MDLEGLTPHTDSVNCKGIRQTERKTYLVETAAAHMAAAIYCNMAMKLECCDEDLDPKILMLE